MRANAFLMVVIVALRAAGSPTEYNILSALAPHVPTTHTSISTPSLVHPPEPSSISNGLELRRAPVTALAATPSTEDVVPVAAAAAPAEPPAVDSPAIAPLPASTLLAPALAPVAPADRAIRQAPPDAVPDALVSARAKIPDTPLLTGDDFVTVQWVETHIGSITQWVPETVSYLFEPMSQAPLPGEGSIGMGTLTEKAGQTQTYWTVVTAAAATPAVDSKPAIAAAVAVGVVGLVM
ncbi:hypothetical protein E8E13_003592 [Curvularia kusanoi]|uniref:Uncharacterized protein n=1 Tax=Curvularia kusanoi TaxID=90978 RepID=A0A9P4TB23_CURKU|nr:hypothetical protein E8E13_003592 [Curvularia kusanoi]